MDVLTKKQYHEFLAFLPKVKMAIHDWLLVTVTMEGKAPPGFTIDEAVASIHALYNDKQGLIYICNDNECIMVLRGGSNTQPLTIKKEIQGVLPEGVCRLDVVPPTAENVARLKILVKFEPPPQYSPLMEKKRQRQENIILIADDDMYMRMLIKKGLGAKFVTEEVIHGGEILSAYKKYLPDILFLDIHMPGKTGLENLDTVLKFDPDAHVVMLSSDSSPENVIWTTKHGAKGFIAKPFVKEKLLESISSCRTVS